MAGFFFSGFGVVFIFFICVCIILFFRVIGFRFFVSVVVAVIVAVIEAVSVSIFVFRFLVSAIVAVDCFVEKYIGCVKNNPQ